MTDTQSQQERIDVRAYLEPIRSRWWMILLVVALATAAAYLYSDSRPKQYTAATDVFVQTSELDRALFETAAELDPERNAANLAAFLQSRAVAERVAEKIGFSGEPSGLTGQIAVERTEGNDFITISATDSTSRGAAKLANAFGAALIELRGEAARDNVEAEISVARRELAQLGEGVASQSARRSLRSRIRRLNVIGSLPIGQSEQVDQAIPPGVPSSPRPRRDAGFAFVLSLILACGAAIGLGRLDRRLKAPERIEEVYGLPMLGAVPNGNPVARDADGRAEIPERMREPFRTMRTNLELRSLERACRTILVTSAMPGEGKSSVVRNLALAYSEAGLRVAVLEADLRKPTLAQLFYLRPDPGFTDVLSKQATVEETLQSVAVAVPPVAVSATARTGIAGSQNGAGNPQLAVLTSGPQAPNPPAILAAGLAQDVLSQLSEHHDVVLIDSPPILAVSDAMPLLSAVDGTILVSRLGLTREDAARRLVELIGRVPNVRVLGVVANDVSEGRQPYSNYGY